MFSFKDLFNKKVEGSYVQLGRKRYPVEEITMTYSIKTPTIIAWQTATTVVVEPKNKLEFFFESKFYDLTKTTTYKVVKFCAPGQTYVLADATVELTNEQKWKVTSSKRPHAFLGKMPRFYNYEKQEAAYIAQDAAEKLERAAEKGRIEDLKALGLWVEPEPEPCDHCSCREGCCCYCSYQNVDDDEFEGGVDE